MDNLEILDLRCLKPERVPVFWMAELSPPEQAEILLEAIRFAPSLTDLTLTALSEDVDVAHLVRYIGRAIMAGRFPALRRLEGYVRCSKDTITRSVMQQMERDLADICADKGIEASMTFKLLDHNTV